jgi:hypothetical protein
MSSPGLCAIAHKDRAIQYAGPPVINANAAAYWMPRLKRGMTRRSAAGSASIKNSAAIAALFRFQQRVLET